MGVRCCLIDTLERRLADCRPLWRGAMHQSNPRDPGSSLGEQVLRQNRLDLFLRTWAAMLCLPIQGVRTNRVFFLFLSVLNFVILSLSP